MHGIYLLCLFDSDPEMCAMSYLGALGSLYNPINTDNLGALCSLYNPINTDISTLGALGISYSFCIVLTSSTLSIFV